MTEPGVSVSAWDLFSETDDHRNTVSVVSDGSTNKLLSEFSDEKDFYLGSIGILFFSLPKELYAAGDPIMETGSENLDKIKYEFELMI